jgi:WD40 repeat protein
MIVLPNLQLVTGSYDKTIKIWTNATKLNDLSESNMQLSRVSQLSKKSATITPLSPLKTLTGHTSAVLSLKYLNDGCSFASGSADRTIKIWNFEKEESIKNFVSHTNDILCM